MAEIEVESSGQNQTTEQTRKNLDAISALKPSTGN